MSETIVAIREFENRELGEYYGKSSTDGFEVETTDQKIILWIDNRSQCCESYGYFWSNDNADEFIGAELLGVTRTDDALNTERLKADAGETAIEEKTTLFVNLETSRGVLQFTAYNAHNGYYGHAAGVMSRQLDAEETL